MTTITAHYVRRPDRDDERGTAWQCLISLPNGDEKRGPVIYQASQPSESDACRTARRLRRYWRVSTAIQERKVA